MKKDRRLFGNNFKLFLSQQEFGTKEIAEKVGCTEYMLFQIMDGRLILTSDEEENIANALKIPVEEFYVQRASQDYEAAGCMECRGSFSNQDNRKLVLDLLDIYCDIQEIMADEIM